MATWGAHLRIADILYDKLDNTKISPIEFVVGNIAPDSGVPDPNDPTKYNPSKTVSHFESSAPHSFDYDTYAGQFFAKEQQKTYSKEAYSFYLGYLTHLIADFAWTDFIYNPLKERDIENYTVSKVEATWKWKKDWYDLDHKFFRDNPSFRTLEIYRSAEGFDNVYLDFFSRTAFDERRKFIVEFYSNHPSDLEREYTWTTEEDMENFIKYAVGFIVKELEKFI